MKLRKANTPLLLAAGLALIVGSGVVHGLQTDRWGQAQALLDAAQRLDEIPTEFNGWTSQDAPIAERQLKGAEAVGSYSRQFQHPKTGHAVNVMILCGRSGPIAVHPPTVCFTGSGWRLQAAPSRAVVESHADESFWNAEFSREEDGIPISIRTKWGWNGDGKWMACRQPRLETARYRNLYKMYVTVPSTYLSPEEAEATAQDFLEQFLPVVNEALFTDD